MDNVEHELVVQCLCHCRGYDKHLVTGVYSRYFRLRPGYRKEVSSTQGVEAETGEKDDNVQPQRLMTQNLPTSSLLLAHTSQAAGRGGRQQVSDQQYPMDDNYSL